MACQHTRDAELARAFERSAGPSSLRRRTFRPLDKPLIPTVDADEAFSDDFEDEVWPPKERPHAGAPRPARLTMVTMPKWITPAAPAPFLRDLSPMLLRSSRGVFSDPDWLYEIKYDGYRILAEWDQAGARLQSKSGADTSRWYPEVVSSLAGFGRGRNVIDGEMCVLDDIGRADFDQLHERSLARRRKPGAPGVVYCVFDLLVLDDTDLTRLPLSERKQMLEHLFRTPPGSLLVVSSVVGEGHWLYQQALGLKIEGIVAKRANSIYVPGARSDHWLKMKRPGGTPAGRFRRGEE